MIQLFSSSTISNRGNASNDEANLAQALIQHQSALKRFIRRSMQQETDVEDIYQKVLLKGLQVKQQSHIKNYLSYGFKMAERAIADHIRESQKQPEEMAQEPVCEQLDLEQQIEHQQRLKLYQQVLTDMPPLRRKIFILRKFNGHSRSEIATELNMSEEAVKKHISRAMQALKQVMKETLGQQYSRYLANGNPHDE